VTFKLYVIVGELLWALIIGTVDPVKVHREWHRAGLVPRLDCAVLGSVVSVLAWPLVLAYVLCLAVRESE
jgi:hypothetical protein